MWALPNKAYTPAAIIDGALLLNGSFNWYATAYVSTEHWANPP